MKHAGPITLLSVAAAAAAAASAGKSAPAPGPSRCGGELWRLKTLSDPARSIVDLTSRSTTISAIADRANPQPVPRRRQTTFQRQTWEVVAQVTAFRLDPGGLRLVLFDDGAYMNAVIPTPTCLGRTTRARAAIVTAWDTFGSACTRSPGRDWQTLGAIAYVRGVGFWSQRRPIRGAAPNGAELYPVTGFRIVVGCRR